MLGLTWSTRGSTSADDAWEEQHTDWAKAKVAASCTGAGTDAVRDAGGRRESWCQPQEVTTAQGLAEFLLCSQRHRSQDTAQDSVHRLSEVGGTRTSDALASCIYELWTKNTCDGYLGEVWKSVGRGLGSPWGELINGEDCVSKDCSHGLLLASLGSIPTFQHRVRAGAENHFESVYAHPLHRFR